MRAVFRMTGSGDSSESLFNAKLFHIGRYILLSVLVLSSNCQSYAEDGVSWGRLRFRPSVTISERYSDNIYREYQNEEEDYITRLLADVALDLAVAPRNYFTLKYQGDFLSYKNSENFRNDHHFGSFSFTSETSKGSHFLFGAEAKLTAVQPYSITDESKDYTFKYYYGDVALALFDFTELGVRYSQGTREFDEDQYRDDDYTRHILDCYFLNSRIHSVPLLLQYRFIHQDNNDIGVYSTDYNSHTFFLGGRWATERKLSGALRVGYFWVEFDQEDVDDFDGLAIDTDLVYRFSEITSIALIVERGIRTPTASDRETGDYFLFTTAGLTITHQKWSKIRTRLYGFYSLRNYKELFTQQNVRDDELYRFGISINYIFKPWLSFVAEYRYQRNDSEVVSVEYTENLATLSVVFSL